MKHAMRRGIPRDAPRGRARGRWARTLACVAAAVIRKNFVRAAIGEPEARAGSPSPP